MPPILPQVHRNPIGTSRLTGQREGQRIRLYFIAIIERMTAVARLPHRSTVVNVHTEKNTIG